MPVSRLEYLFECYVNRKCSEEEEKELMALIKDERNEPQIKLLIEKAMNETEAELELPGQVSADILHRILNAQTADVVMIAKRRSKIKVMLSAAAVIVILLVAGIFYEVQQQDISVKNKTASIVSSEKNKAIVPGGNHARLVLADGTTIVLDSVQNGTIQHVGASVSKQNGMLVYNGKIHSKPGMPVTFNTLNTPRGGQYMVVLPDGSKVWLNASSSLRFPTAFVGKKREVELTGEAYFEVAKNKEMPFYVNVKGMQVEVLGTHFNVNAYADDNSIKTSLLEGSVKIKKGSISGLLKPGQQGILENNKNDLRIDRADMDEVVAWKNGLFQFDGANIKTIMLEISRWYNMEIVYEGSVAERSFVGKISRDAQLSDVLKILELSGVKFKLEGRKIIVQ
jgi:ferric-dicitrate binding protein FerR (iron transport regulator)